MRITDERLQGVIDLAKEIQYTRSKNARLEAKVLRLESECRTVYQRLEAAHRKLGIYE